MTDHRTSIESNLQAFALTPLRQASLDLLDTLDYRSDKTTDLEDSKPQTFLDFIKEHNPAAFNEEKALVADWKSADLLFQLTDEEISGQPTLFKDTDVDPGLLQSYLFFAIELNGDSAINGNYARGKLTAIARQINRVFPMPVMVLIKHLADKQPVLSIAVINRRRNKTRADKDVLEKTTIIRDISLTEPHRGHLDILNDLVFDNLSHPQKLLINNFDALHTAWEQIFNVELLNNRFYKELSNWYFWALPQVKFPADLEPDDEKRRATGLIRLLTRLVFCWFLKEKGLILNKLFDATELAQVLKGFDPKSEGDSNYYQAILQNLFFATLNQRMDNDDKGKPYRRFISSQTYQGKNKEHGILNLFRYPELFADPATALDHFADTPFLNGGLFECLDREDPDDKNRLRHIDGFTSKEAKRPKVPNYLFFSNKTTADLSKAYGDNKRKKEPVTGLINILNGYKFTIVENTPIDQEIALDPELLGKVFENLLASYNEETKATARKQTGSFYTPRPIVDYMVDESLKAHLTRALVETADMREADAEAGLDILFTYTEQEHAFTPAQVDALITAIDTVKILDPACGSGAFPMGVLHKLVYILSKLDPDNEHWKKTQLDKLDSTPMREELERIFADNDDDYGRKLYLIQSCLYGVDIQPIAIQISKLRFFISLVCDQQTNRKKDNHGIRPLPNLETKFVAANSLIRLPGAAGLAGMSQTEIELNPRIDAIHKEIETLYHSHFSIQRRVKKLNVQDKVKDLRTEMANLLGQSGTSQKKSQHIAEWDAFDPQSTADFFDPQWMFGSLLTKGFDVVIGNPPYIQLQKDGGKLGNLYAALGFQTFVRSGDIYQLFYERACQLLKAKHGFLCFITSNSWLKAEYGGKLRRYFCAQHTPLKLLEMGKDIFDNAIVDANILLLRNGKSEITARAVNVGRLPHKSLPPQEKDWGELRPQGEGPWMALSAIERDVMDKMEAVGTRLNTWDIAINYGIKTGYNEAFIINTATKDALIDADPNSARILKPILRGRDIKRYQAQWAGLWVIATFPSLHIDIEDYPAIEQHLLSYGKDRLEQAGKTISNGNKSRKWTPHQWFELQDVCAYHADFEREKLVWIELVDNGRFAYDHSGIYGEATTFIMTGKHLKYLCTLLNTKLIRWFFQQVAPTSGTGTLRWKKVYVETIPIPKISAAEQRPFIALIDQILTAKANNPTADTSTLEHEIDQHVYQLYQLTPDEIKTIEST